MRKICMLGFGTICNDDCDERPNEQKLVKKTKIIEKDGYEWIQWWVVVVTGDAVTMNDMFYVQLQE